MVEVLVATFVMALGLTSAIICLQVGLSNFEVARKTTLVSQVLQDEAERIRLLNWNALDALPASAEIPVPPQFDGTPVSGEHVTVTRTIVDVSGYTDLKQITLIAYWTGTRGQSHSRNIHLRYARGGVFDYYYGSSS